jgi:hypothetical protein
MEEGAGSGVVRVATLNLWGRYSTQSQNGLLWQVRIAFCARFV